MSGKNIRTFYFIDGPSPAEAVSNFVKLTGLPPMHPAWALGYEQSTRAWMGFGELDFVTTYFREKKIPVDGFDLLTTYGGEGGIGQRRQGLSRRLPRLLPGLAPEGDYKTYNQKLLPNGATDIEMLRERGFRPIVHGYWVGDYSDAAENEKHLAGLQELLVGRLVGLVARRHRVLRRRRGHLARQVLRGQRSEEVHRRVPRRARQRLGADARQGLLRDASAATFPTSASTS